MIKLNYPGRMGNNLFLYAFARIVAEKFHLKMVENSGEFENKNNFPEALLLDGEIRGSLVVLNGESNSDSLLDEAFEICANGDGLYLHGYFQNYELYLPYRSKIKQWLNLSIPKVIVDEDDCILHLRREDYLESGSQLSLNYYINAVNSMNNVKSITVVGKDIEPWVYEKLGRFLAPIKIPKMSSIEEFNLIRSHNKIIMSNSTFAWWASFLSEAKSIIAPKPLRGYWSDEQTQRLLSEKLFTIIEDDNRT